MVSLKLQTDRRNQRVRIGIRYRSEVKIKKRDEKCQDYKRRSLPTPNPL
jgi:long-subunit fatty acid transport protein